MPTSSNANDQEGKKAEPEKLTVKKEEEEHAKANGQGSAIEGYGDFMSYHIDGGPREEEEENVGGGNGAGDGAGGGAEKGGKKDGENKGPLGKGDGGLGGERKKV